MKNDEMKYEKAKKIFFDNYCILNNMTVTEKVEFDIYNVPKNIVKLWVKEKIDTITTEIYSDNIDEFKLVIKTNILFRLYGSYDLDLKELMSVIIYLNNKNLLSKMIRTSKRGKSYFLFATYLVYDSSLNSLVAEENHFKSFMDYYLYCMN